MRETIERIVGLTIVVVMGFALAVSSQTPTPTGTVLWNQFDAASPSQAQGFTYRLTVVPAGATTPIGPLVLTGVTCTGVAVTCTAPLPTAAGAAWNIGTRSTMTVQDTVSGTAETGASLPFIPVPSAPTGLKVSRSS